jgi:HEAT repeat protein
MPQNTIAEKVVAFLQQEETDYSEAAKLGEAALPFLKSIIMSNDERMASKATSLAGMIAGDKKIDALKEASKHPSVLVRIAAAAAAKELTADQAEQVLTPLMNDDDIGVSKFTLQSIRSKNISGRFRERLAEISEKNSHDGIKTLAADVLKSAR